MVDDHLPSAVDPESPIETTADESPSAQDIADAVLDIPGVTGLHGGMFGEIATYLPGGRVSGIVVDDDAVEVHIVVDVGHDLRAVAEQVRDVASDLTGLPASVTVEDISVLLRRREQPADNPHPDTRDPETPEPAEQAPASGRGLPEEVKKHV